MERISNYIGGQFVEPVGRAFLDNVEPATGRAYSLVPDSDERDVELAVNAAQNAFPVWSSTPAAERFGVLLRIAELIEAELAPLAAAESTDTGKPIRLARTVDIPRAAANFRHFATAVLHARSEFYATDDLALNYTLRRPRGVAGVISPWNLPLYLLTWKVAPALATGNTVVAKPSELTPMTAFRLCALCERAGLPAGVLNVVHGVGSKAGAALVRHPAVPTVSFTGGTVTGAQIARTAAPMFKRLALELGGKNPNIVFADADFDVALTESVRAAFINQGQLCLSGSRIFVERPIHDRFVEHFVNGARSLRFGDPMNEQTDQGALVSRSHSDKVLSYLHLARSEGGRILCGGGVPSDVPPRCRDGYFIEPTVVVGLPPACRTSQEEIFGPVVTITPFDTEEEVIELANATPYGLSASLWTRDVGRAHRLADRIQAGTVWVNCWLLRDLRVPFGGVKSSGVGREGGDEALRFFTEPKTVCVHVPQAEWKRDFGGTLPKVTPQPGEEAEADA